MVSVLAEKIHDNRLLRLIKQMLQAGYLEDWEWNATLSGAQGGVVTPRHYQALRLEMMALFADIDITCG